MTYWDGVVVGTFIFGPAYVMVVYWIKKKMDRLSKR